MRRLKTKNTEEVARKLSAIEAKAEKNAAMLTTIRVGAAAIPMSATFAVCALTLPAPIEIANLFKAVFIWGAAATLLVQDKTLAAKCFK